MVLFSVLDIPTYFIDHTIERFKVLLPSPKPPKSTIHNQNIGIHGISLLPYNPHTISQSHGPPNFPPSLQLHSSPSFLLPIHRIIPPSLPPNPHFLIPKSVSKSTGNTLCDDERTVLHCLRIG